MQTDVLIVGGGFGGLTCFRAIDRRRQRVLLVTNRNHFLFTPLLAQASVGTVEVRSIVEPIYSFEKRRGEILIAEAVDIAPEEKKLIVSYEQGRRGEVSFKTLVLAAGAATATFGIPGVKEHCHFLKEMQDARRLREKVLRQIEKAYPLSGPERKRALHFVVVGAGPTGVEVACEIDDIIRHDLGRHYRDLVPETKILIVEAMKDILSVFDRTLAAYARRKLAQRGIEIRTECPVQGIEKGLVRLPSGETLEADTIIWAAGNAPHTFIQQAALSLRTGLGRGGRIPVDERLRVRGPHEGFYALGDCALAGDSKGNPLPATAQVAMKQGAFLAKEINSGKAGRFHFRSMGMLASLGHGTAIADLGKVQFKGSLAWWFWKTAYLTRLVSLRNKVSVAFDWIKVRLFGRNIARIEFDRGS